MVSGTWIIATILPGGGGKRVSGEKGISQLHPQEGFWTLQLSSAGVSVCTSPEPFQILSYRPWQIGVALDHDGGKATFTNARLKRSSVNSHLPSLGEFSLSCGLTAGGPNLH